VDPRLQRRVQRYGWDRAAHDYERSWQKQLAPAQERLLDVAALRKGERVLDVACGTGLVTFAAAAAVGAAGAVVGTDISQGMIDLATERARAEHVTNVRFERMEAEELRVSDASFDVVLCALGMMYVPDARKGIAEMARALVPGGRAVAVVWGQRNRCGWADVFPIVDARVKSEVCPLFFSLGTGDRMQSLFEAAGLVAVETTRLDVRLEWTSPDEALGAAFVGGPVALAYSRFDEPTRAEVHAEYLASLAPWRDGSRFNVPGEFVVVSGTKPG
jgi:ubiquinone/menaquinone biosynthesis C-methylase UbiE